MNDARALLVTDLVDSTAIANALGDAAMSALWAEHDRRARQLLQAWRGREIDRSDGFFLLFDRAGDALGFALDWHRALALLSAERLAGRGLVLATRTGIHVGAVQLRENPAEDVARGAKPLEADGLAKAVAARAMALARGAQTLLSASAHEALLGELAGGLAPALPALRSHGRWKLKGLDDPIELFEAGDERTTFEPPEDAEKAHRVVWRDGHWLPVREVSHQLPAEPDRFVGRGASLRALARLFDDGARLVTVHGMGGSGKTRLALHHGWRWLGDYAAGVWFCDLAAARDLDGLVRAVAQGLQVPLGRGDAVELIGHAIAGRGACLVILDNFEQIAALAETSVARWLKRAPKARFLVTSRELLKLPGERLLELAPLTRDEGVELFQQRAAAARSPVADAANVEENRQAVASLVELLDGLPLAIELAAARSALLAPQEMLRRMSERFALLVGGRGRTARQATLRATLDWSWELLSDAERSALAQLSVFEGGATIAAAEATIDVSDIADAPPVIDLLQSLIDKSLVRSDAKHRLMVLEMVREYAAECLAAPGRFGESGPAAMQAAQRRHAASFSAMGENEALHDACVEFANLIAATRHAVGSGDCDVALKTLRTTWAAVWLRGPFILALELAEAVAGMDGLTPEQRTTVDCIAGWSLRVCGRIADSRLRLDAALRSAARAGDAAGEALALALLADLHVNEGRVDAAQAALQRAHELVQEVGDDQLACRIHFGMGNIADQRGRLDEAARHYGDSLGQARRQGLRRWEGGALGNLGMVRDQQGRSSEARALYESALAVARELGDRQWEGNHLCNLGLLLHLHGEFEAARKALDDALTTARMLGHRRLECITSINLALVEADLHHDDAARSGLEDALRIACDLGDKRTEGQIRGKLGALYARMGQHEPARQALHAGSHLLDEVGDELSRCLLLCDRAEAEYRAGDVDAARATLLGARSAAAPLLAGHGSELGRRLAAVGRLIAVEFGAAVSSLR